MGKIHETSRNRLNQYDRSSRGQRSWHRRYMRDEVRVGRVLAARVSYRHRRG